MNDEHLARDIVFGAHSVRARLFASCQKSIVLFVGVAFWALQFGGH